MRLRLSSVGLLLLVVSCGGVSRMPVDEAAEPPTQVIVDEKVVATTAQTRLVWKGFESTNAEPQTLAAVAHGALPVYDTPESPEPEMTLDPTTILGTTTVLGVVTAPSESWVEVMLPVRPNGSTGWVSVDEVSLFVVDGEIIVDLSERQLTYTVDGVDVLTTEVGIGSDHSQTPTGHYFVTDRVTLSDPNSPWGPHALGISARSDTITEFNGGDGIIGIHGTNNPGSIGDNISLGCVRLPNDVITSLYEMVPLGTRVTVKT